MERIRLLVISCITILGCFYAQQLFNPLLTGEEPFVIGEATAKGISVGARISNTYKLLFFVAILFFTGYYFAKRLILRAQQVDSTILTIGIAAGMIAFINPQFIEITQWMIFLYIGSNVWYRFKGSEVSEVTLLIISVLFMAYYQLFHSALIGTLIATGIVLIHTYLKNAFTQYVLFLAAALPMVVTLSIEGSFISAAHGLHVSYLVIACVLILLLVGFVKRFQSVNDEDLLKKWILPVSLAGIALIHVYHPMLDQPLDLFEYANKVNPVMRWQQGEWPFTDHISSHLISDYFWTFVYAALNGVSTSAALLIYDNFIFVVGALAIYYLIRILFQNSNTALWFLLFSPALFLLIPPYYALVCWPLILFLRVFQEPSKRNTRWFVFSVISLSLWRLDIGVSVIIASLGCFLFTALQHRDWWRSALLQIFLIASPFLILFVIFVLNYPDQIQQLIGYFGASQAHGFSVMTLTTSNLYLIDYFMLPIGLIFVITYHLVRTWRNWNVLQAYLIFAGLFYFANLQRGMVRHSFVEGYDTQILSLGWSVIVIHSIIWLRRFTETTWKPVFLAGTFLMPFLVSIAPGSQHRSIFLLQAGFSLKDIPLAGAQGLERIKPVQEFEEGVRPVISFLKRNLSGENTFLDFSNSPMLYFYSQKRVPSYFNQYLQNTVSTKLQRLNLIHLKDFPVNYVVFSQFPEGFFDNSDGIPNKVRYHVIATHIFNHYEPDTIIGKFRIWRRKSSLTWDRTKLLPEQWNLGLIPALWKPEKEEQWRKLPDNGAIHEKCIVFERALQPGTFVEVSVNSEIDQDIRVSKPGFDLTLTLKQGQHQYYLPVGVSENCVYTKDTLHFLSERSIQLKSVQMLRLDAR